MRSPAAIALVLALLFFASCDPFHTQFDDIENASIYHADSITEAPSAGRLRVMNWNVKFGGGRIDFFFDCHGDTVLMSKGQVTANLEGLAAKINHEDPHILLVQEIDTCSKRTAYVDQVQWLLDHTNLNYAAYASQWKADYVPSDGIGRVNSGNAILSKYPIVSATRIALPLISEDDALTQYFYLKRNILKVTLSMDGSQLTVFNIHTSAYSQDGTKKRQIERFEQELAAAKSQGAIFIAGGDLNTLPPGTTKTAEFPDSVCEDEAFQADDYTEESTWLEGLYGDYNAAIPLAQYQADNAPYFSHTTDGGGFWNRKLDYLFSSLPLEEGLVHQDADSGGIETMPLSDHAPLTCTWVIQ